MIINSALEETGHGHVGVRRAHQSSACLCEFIGFWGSYFMAESQKRKERVSSNSSIESRDSETSSPADKKKSSENIQHILERLVNWTRLRPF